MSLNFLGACHLKAVSVTSKIEAPQEEWAYKEWQRTVNSVKKWLQSKGETQDLDLKAAQRVKYTLPGKIEFFLYILLSAY